MMKILFSICTICVKEENVLSYWVTAHFQKSKAHQGRKNPAAPAILIKHFPRSTIRVPCMKIYNTVLLMWVAV